MSTHAALLGREEPTLTSLLARFAQMTLIETPEAKCFYKTAFNDPLKFV